MSDYEDFKKNYTPPDYTEIPSVISIARTLVKNGLTDIELVFYPNFVVFYKGQDLLPGTHIIDNIAQLSSRHVIIEKYVSHEKDFALDNLTNSIASRPIGTLTYRFNSFIQFIDFLKENRARRIYIYLSTPLGLLNRQKII